MATTAALLLFTLAQAAADARSDGEDFLVANAEKEGVVVMPSGLQYEVMTFTPDKQAPSPGPNDRCECHYTGTLIDGTVFDSSVQRGKPAKFKPSQVIKGWTEALQLMQVGDKWKIFVPSELAYGDKGAANVIPGGAVLIFELELLSIDPPDESMMAMAKDFLGQDFVGPIKLWQVLAFFIFVAYKSGMFGGGDGVKATASHILVADEETCASIKAKLPNGNNVEKLKTAFAAAAAEHSTCPSGKSGGSLGSFAPGSMVPAFDRVVFDPATPLNVVQGPVQTNFGFHLLLVTDSTPLNPPRKGAAADAPKEAKKSK